MTDHIGTCQRLHTMLIFVKKKNMSHYMTVILRGGGDGGGVKGENAANKPVTTVQDCVTTCVSMELADIFKETRENFHFRDKKLIFWWRSWTIGVFFPFYLQLLLHYM